jgi:hypothetical protein
MGEVNRFPEIREVGDEDKRWQTLRHLGGMTPSIVMAENAGEGRGR